MREYKIPSSVLEAVPISAEVFAGAIISICGSRIIKRAGQRRSAMLGAVCFMAGLILRFLQQNFWLLTIRSMVLGCGWGMLLLIINIKIAEEEEESLQEDGFTGYSGVCQNGVNAGVVFGGFLLYWVNYQKVFFAGMLLGLLVVWFLKSYVMDAGTVLAKSEKEGTPLRKYPDKTP